MARRRVRCTTRTERRGLVVADIRTPLSGSCRTDAAFFVAARNATLGMADPIGAVEGIGKLAGALERLLERYVDLVECGDCDHWDPEEKGEVIEARAALAPYRKEK